MTYRLIGFNAADHAEFYKQYNFGAFLGYSDYMSLVIIDAKCIETVTTVSL